MSDFETWLTQQLTAQPFTITPILGDASFRRYYRLHSGDATWIAVDAPPETENSRAFVAISRALKRHGLCVPEVLAADLERGYLLVTDLGEQLYDRCLTGQTVDILYQHAIDGLLRMQGLSDSDLSEIPQFDYNALWEELDRFRHWYLERHIQHPLQLRDQDVLRETFERLIDSALEQPQVFVHRDYHSRNLLAMPQGEVGILDFQDAVLGPVTYDLVSLLRDCYIDWQRDRVIQWALGYYDQSQERGIMPSAVTPAQFMLWFDWMGCQRHLKAIYIFARKWHRDHNDQYLQYIPRCWRYIESVCAAYPELQPFLRFRP